MTRLAGLLVSHADATLVELQAELEDRPAFGCAHSFYGGW
jgi:hypothetical protein